jgi:hypothetical protein
MELSDYLQKFLLGLSPSSLSFTNVLELEGQTIKGLINQYGNTPSTIELDRATNFLINIERWKADCREEQTGNAIRNNPREIWVSLKGAINASDDKDALLSIMRLTGFGAAKDAETGQRRAKRATAVLRFLDPDTWGVVDWRVVAILSLYKKNNLNIDGAVQAARKYKMNEMAASLDLINEDSAIDIVKQYRIWRNDKLPRTVDVELALYGASFIAWPRPKK